MRNLPHASLADYEARDSVRESRPTSRSQRGTRAVVAHIASAVATILTVAVLLAPIPAHADNVFIRAGEITLDLVIVRPLGVGALAFGFVCFVPAGLFASTPRDLRKNGWSSSDAASAWDVFVVTPFQQTFQTPLGEIEG